MTTTELTQPTSSRAEPLLANNFRVLISQELKTKEDALAHSFPLPNLSNAVQSFDFFEVPSDPIYNEDFDEDDDEDAEEFEEVPPEFQCHLTYGVSYAVLQELNEAAPLPEDSEMVVRIEHMNRDGAVVFTHTFKGVFDLGIDISNKKSQTGVLTNELVLHCWSWTLFELNKGK